MSNQFFIELIMALAILIAPIGILIQRAKATDDSPKGLGVRATQFLSAGTLAPALIILALERVIDGCTVAALIGAFVGYTFSNIGEFERRRSTKAT